MLPSIRTLSLRESIEIECSLDTVRDAFDDLDAWPEWNDICRESRWTSGERWAVGSAFHMTLRMARRPVGFSVFVREFEPHAVTWESTVFSITGTRRFTFDERTDRSMTLVTDYKTFHSSVLPVRLFYPRPIIQAMSRAWLASLKKRAEMVSAAGE